MSFEQSSSVTSYMNKRFRRIYPAYILVIMLSAFGLYLASSKDFMDYFSLMWLKYVISNAVFLNFIQLTLPGVFDENKYNVVNGALWTLKIEVMFYITVPFFVFLCRRFGYHLVLILGYIGSFLYVYTLQTLASKTGSGLYLEPSRQLPGQLCYFIAGAMIYYNLNFFERYIKYLLIIAVLILAVENNTMLPLLFLKPFSLAIIILFLALFVYVGNFGKYGDFSYGVYIIHFPLVQLLVASKWFVGSPWLFLVVALSATITSAFFMWHFVEKRFLLRSSHYVLLDTVVKKE